MSLPGSRVGAPTPVEWYLWIGNVLSLDEGMSGPSCGASVFLRGWRASFCPLSLLHEDSEHCLGILILDLEPPDLSKINSST